jgi:hypothetical protein
MSLLMSPYKSIFCLLFQFITIKQKKGNCFSLYLFSQSLFLGVSKLLLLIERYH